MAFSDLISTRKSWALPDQASHSLSFILFLDSTTISKENWHSSFGFIHSSFGNSILWGSSRHRGLQARSHILPPTVKDGDYLRPAPARAYTAACDLKANLSWSGSSSVSPDFPSPSTRWVVAEDRERSIWARCQNFTIGYPNWCYTLDDHLRN